MEKHNPGKSFTLASVPDLGANRFGQLSPLRLFTIIISSIFVAEVFAMLIVNVLRPHSYALTTLIDAGIMIVLIFPILYWFSFRPLIRQIEKLQQAQEQVNEMARFPALNPDPVLQVDASGRIRMSNPAGNQLGLGTHSELFELMPDLRSVDLRGFIDSGSIQHTCEARLGDRIFQWTIRGAPDIDLAFLYGQDITERRRSEEVIKLLSSVVEQTADTVVVTDREGVIEYINPAFERVTGYAKEEILGKTPRVLKSGVHDERLYGELWSTILRGDVFHSEITNQKKNGELLHEVKTITPLRDAQGNITRFVATGKDITERKRAEDKLHRAYDDLEQRVQERTEELKIANAELEKEISEREQVEMALRQSREDLDRAQAVGQIGWWRLDVRRNVLTWSEENHRIFGIPIGTPLSYETFLGTVHPDDREYVDTQWRAGLAGEPYDIEHRIVADGKVKWVREKAYLEFDGESQLLGGFGITQDITARKQAETALRESEAKYRNLFENMTEEVHFWQLVRDESGCIETWQLVDANPPTLRSWGRQSIEEIKGKTAEEILGPGAVEHYMPVVQKIMTERVPYSFEDYFPNLDRYFRFTSVPLEDHFITTGADITVNKKAEQALRTAHTELERRVEERTAELAAANRELSNEITERNEVERQLRIQTAAMETAANGIIITDPRGTILWSNPAVSQISGYSHRELIGQSTHIFSSGRHDQDFYRQMWDTIRVGDVWRGETTNRRKDGNLYIEEQTITPVRNEDGELSHFIAIKQDVTERKLIYSQLEASNRELRTLTAAEREQRFLAEGLVQSSVVLNMSLELNAVLDHIFEQTRRIIPYLAADIVLIDADVASVVRQWGFEGRPEPRTVFENDNLRLLDFPTWEKICESKSTVLIPNTQLEDQWKPYFGMTWIRSYLGAPLVYGDQVIGIINLISNQADAFHEAMAKNLRAFAAPAAVAIQNARLYETEQHNRKVAEILSSASVDLAQTLDTQMVMETILDYVQFVLPSDAAFVIMSEGDERYRIRAARVGNGDHVRRESLLDQTIDMLSDPVIRSYFTRYENTYIPDSRALPDWHPPLELGFLNCWLGIPLESMGKILGIVVAANATANSFTKNQIQLMEAVVKQAVVALQNAWLFEQVRSGRERLQQLSRHLVEVQENERKYIARELHDETSQSLTSLKIGLQVIEQKAGGNQQLLEQVANLKSLADETLESLHHLAVNLRPASLDHLGLVDALSGLIESVRQRSGMTAHFKTMGVVRATLLTEELEASIYRIVQESLTNVIRHAQAAHVDIILEWQDEKVLLMIEDDGIGIDMQKARESGHLGLIGMQERAEMLGGRLLVESTPQAGTTLVVEIPYAHSNTASR